MGREIDRNPDKERFLHITRLLHVIIQTKSPGYSTESRKFFAFYYAYHAKMIFCYNIHCWITISGKQSSLLSQIVQFFTSKQKSQLSLLQCQPFSLLRVFRFFLFIIIANVYSLPHWQTFLPLTLTFFLSPQALNYLIFYIRRSVNLFIIPIIYLMYMVENERYVYCTSYT